MRAYDEHGITETVNSCYGELHQCDPQLPCDVDAVLEMHRRVWQWIYQPPLIDLDGFLCRCIVACWVFVPQLRSYSQTGIAARFGKKKQSLNRWIANFKQEFPEIGKHLEHTRT